jgi:anti-sigma factor RsiW
MRPETGKLHAHAYVDGEMAREDEFLFEQGLAADRRLRVYVSGLERLSADLRRDVRCYAAPADLRASLAAAAHRAQPHSGWRSRTTEAAWSALRRWLAWRPLVPSLSLAIACLALAGVLASRPDPDARVREDLVASHVRATRMLRPVQLASSEQSMVRPWFVHELGFSPPVRPLDVPGIAILGGRVDAVDGRRVAVIVYQRGEHRVDHYVWPTAAADTEAEVSVMNGFRVAQWTRGGMAHRLVSDLGEQELQVIVQACYQEEKG